MICDGLGDEVKGHSFNPGNIEIKWILKSNEGLA